MYQEGISFVSTSNCGPRPHFASLTCNFFNRGVQRLSVNERPNFIDLNTLARGCSSTDIPSRFTRKAPGHPGAFHFCRAAVTAMASSSSGSSGNPVAIKALSAAANAAPNTGPFSTPRLMKSAALLRKRYRPLDSTQFTSTYAGIQVSSACPGQPKADIFGHFQIQNWRLGGAYQTSPFVGFGVQHWHCAARFGRRHAG